MITNIKLIYLEKYYFLHLFMCIRACVGVRVCMVGDVCVGGYRQQKASNSLEMKLQAIVNCLV